MLHDTAFKLVAQHAPSEAGRRWNTTHRTGCDTAWAVADQYGDDEVDDAIADLHNLASGNIPDGWEPADAR